MQSVSDISKVIIGEKISDAVYSEEEPPRNYISGKIILGVSNNDDVHYDWFDDIIKRQDNNTLFLDNFHGKLLLPKRCGVQILQSNRIISGLVNYPTYLNSTEEINIMIDKESGLDLLLSTMGVAYLNGKIIPKIVEDVDPEKTPTIIGKDFEEYEDRFGGNMESRKPKIINSKYGTIADFKHIDDYCPIDTCMKYNLVVMYSDHGDMNVLYENFSPSITHKSGFKILQSIRRYEQNLERAYKSEDYLRIRDIERKLDSLYQAAGRTPKFKKGLDASIAEKSKTNSEKGSRHIQTMNDIIQNNGSRNLK